MVVMDNITTKAHPIWAAKRVLTRDKRCLEMTRVKDNHPNSEVLAIAVQVAITMMEVETISKIKTMTKEEIVAVAHSTITDTAANETETIFLFSKVEKQSHS
eukprot:CAMPEP_0176369496 /NCGR_PEP_ID=MMETSP0126-20121128/23326_1 /TAXON_ID=141414 ORGANISM="Strombidinopsis acuminatum, Strain SPMC142" /NCGR_SAMPLE_ID=MMETSP0126 /ASSEMBLY_ACC=CAM_ASM_000229 /LENGTH=101 /DNA_ID=CAMNT_0017728151 /DNA_START=4548 /DNA_END=4853 /DNA_ORIENTATION=-